MWHKSNISCMKTGFVLLMSLAVLSQGCEKPTETPPPPSRDMNPVNEETSRDKPPGPPVIGQPELVLIKGGKFINTKSNYFDKNVTISDFYISKYEVAQKEWTEVMGSNPSKFKGDNLPVEMVAWYDCIEYCNKKSIKDSLKPCYNIDKNKKDPNNVNDQDDIKWTVTINAGADGYRLPTEMEWEYAAGGGQLSKSYTYSGGNNIDEVAWYWKNAGDKKLTGFWSWPVIEKNHNKTKTIGALKPNELGLYDMSGNVREWCWDWRESSGPDDFQGRVWRGGGWIGGDFCCESSYHGKFEASGKGPDQGFRVCRSQLTQNVVKDE